MKALIVEDDYITSQVMYAILLGFGETNVAEDGFKALELFNESIINKEPYNIIFLDIMMPEMDGQAVLSEIRKIEYQNGIIGLDAVKIIMTTALDDYKNISTAFKHQCEGYIVKPIDKDKIVNVLIEQNLIE
jgi:two-component system, chemotaxis family, chemotaxis protein CheY